MSLTMYTSGFSKQQLHSRYVLQLLLETWKLLRGLPNINRVSTCHSKEITVCGKNARHILLSFFIVTLFNASSKINLRTSLQVIYMDS